MPGRGLLQGAAVSGFSHAGQLQLFLTDCDGERSPTQMNHIEQGPPKRDRVKFPAQGLDLARVDHFSKKIPLLSWGRRHSRVQEAGGLGAARTGGNKLQSSYLSGQRQRPQALAPIVCPSAV